MERDEFNDILNDLGRQEVPRDICEMAENMADRFHDDLVGGKRSCRSIWREHVMKNRIAHMAVAAAIILAVSIVLYHLGVSPDGTSVVWADVLEKVESISAVTYRVKMTITYPQQQMVLG